MKIKILLVDDDAELCTEISRFLETKSYEIKTAATVSEAMAAWQEYAPDVVLLDLKLPDGEGTQVLKEVKSKSGETMVVMLSGYGSIPKAVDAIKQGAEDFLTKPVDPDHLLLALEKLIEQKRLRNRLLIQELEIADQKKSIVGSSKQQKEALSTCKAAALSDSTVLITGETGTGKHLFAHFVHQNSPRKELPFVYVNCASLSETLLESDLFGHEKGAFTGAHQQKKGRAELAHQGSLFLDEIGELPLNLQAKILHFIEYGQFQRVGGTQNLRADTRIICATNKNLADEVKAGKFREDLFYRINVIQIEITPLRERRGDIPLLLDHFLQIYSHETGRPQLQIDDSVIESLINYPWPGNIRELQNAMERAVVLCKSNRLTKSDFPFLTAPLKGESDEPFQPRPLQEALTDFKRRYISQLLQQTEGNQSQAARILQIQRTYLNRLIKELGV